MQIEDYFSNKKRFYPELSFKHIQNPNRVLAFPVLGFVFKGIILLPIFIELLVLMVLFFLVVILINPFIILFSGEYWQFAYELNVGVMKLSLKTYSFFTGLTNQYPWFNLEINDELFTLVMEKPKTPNKVLNLPILGILFKVIILLPFWLVSKLVGSAASIAYFFSSLPIFFQGRYPKSAYEITGDNIRLNLAGYAYITGLSDTYPSMYVSLNHKKIKVFLLILGFILTFLNFGSSTPGATRTNYSQSSQNIIFK